MRNIILLILFWSINISAQEKKKIQLINANRIISSEMKHPDYWLYTGKVSFSHEGSVMNCDSAYHYKKYNKITAFGKIQINKGDTILIKGQKLIYDGNKKIAKINGNVSLKDQYTHLTTEKITYDLKEDQAYYNTSGKVIEKKHVLYSKKGRYIAKSYLFHFEDDVNISGSDYKIETDTLIYNSKTKKVFFIGPSFIYSEENTIYCENGWHNLKSDISQFNNNAHIKSERYIIKGDSLFYDKNKRYGKAINNISIIDTINDLIIHGNIAEYFEENERLEVTEKPSLIILFDKDTLFIEAKKFISKNNNSHQEILAYNHVKIFKNNMQAICDSMYYNLDDSIILLYYNPVLWVNDIQFCADTTMIKLENGEINKIYFCSNSIIVEKADSIHYNQIKGQKMIGFFVKNSMKYLDVLGNGESLFLVEDDQKKKIGFNKTISSNIQIKIKKKKISSIVYKKLPEEVTIPFQEMKEKDLYLNGFSWQIEKKPERRNYLKNNL